MKRPSSGFSKRLKVALSTNGINTGPKLAKAIRVSRATAYRLLRTDNPCRLDSCTIFALVDATGFSGRWLFYGEGPPTCRQQVTADEAWLLEGYRQLDPHEQEIIAAALKGLVS